MFSEDKFSLHSTNVNTDFLGKVKLDIHEIQTGTFDQCYDHEPFQLLGYQCSDKAS